MKPKEIQSFNWLAVGSQRTGKTALSLGLIAQMQLNAYRHNKIKRVLIFNPQDKNPIFQRKSLIKENVRHYIPNWEMPGAFRKISYKQIQEAAKDKSNLYDWCVVTDGDLTNFSDQTPFLRDFVILFDDQNNIAKGNLAGRRFENFLDCFAQNRVRSNDCIITFHSFRQIPPALWTYFQRAIVKQTTDKKEGFDRIQNCEDLLVKAQMQVREENKVTKYPNNLRLSERIVWMDQEYLFYRDKNNNLITKIDGVYYKAIADDIVQL